MNIFIFILFVFLLYVIKSFIDKNKKFSNNDPIGNKIEWPILGSIHKISKLPHRKLNDMSMTLGDGRMFRVWLGDRYTIVVTDPVIIKEIWSKNFMNFTNRYHTDTAKLLSGNYTNLATSDYETWKPMRALVSSSFTKTKIRTMTTLIESQSRHLIETMKEFQRSNQVFYPERYCKKFAMNVVLGIAFSKSIPDEEDVNVGIMAQLIEPFNMMLKAMGHGSIINFVTILKPLLYVKSYLVLREIEKCRAYIKTIYDEHLIDFDAENPRDLFDIVIAECKDSVDRILRVSIDLLLAGSDTSASTIEWFMLFMINHPEVQEKVAKELKELNTNEVNLSHKPNAPYTNAVIKEVLRIRPTAPMGLNRSNNEDTEICGYFIPKETQLLMNIYSVHHNPKYWPNPEQFNPDRFLEPENVNNHETWIPFGVGPRNCVGLNLAIEEIFVATTNIILNFKLSSASGTPINDEEIYVIYRNGLATTTANQTFLKSSSHCYSNDVTCLFNKSNSNNSAGGSVAYYHKFVQSQSTGRKRHSGYKINELKSELSSSTSSSSSSSSSNKRNNKQHSLESLNKFDQTLSEPISNKDENGNTIVKSILYNNKTVTGPFNELSPKFQGTLPIDGRTNASFLHNLDYHLYQCVDGRQSTGSTVAVAPEADCRRIGLQRTAASSRRESPVPDVRCHHR
ncbi:hypothetical protein PPL_05981 [Heterostelium album PN500]|uniref:Cytochrome P450 n=1 Tax=Heterostelium pallidum (strain ATCC 26659 / Pp 5 / PN500) TaxID=670386 RepID=D3BBW1_HETP5|nr:hypothetical protein PPL_05981 [Heterostelium album PN500]EFA81144.1 hypothetical protein PPL_05981 [Heterostelium album PN500]|eukprot:XP_020433262.1 hypothetical protein PPL_05981 [Heterostelium album PN500]